MMATYQCSTELHNGVATCADYFVLEMDKEKGEPLLMGRGYAACEDHVTLGLLELAPADGTFAYYGIRRITEREKAEFHDIQDQLAAAKVAKAKP